MNSPYDGGNPKRDEWVPRLPAPEPPYPHMPEITARLPPRKAPRAKTASEAAQKATATRRYNAAMAEWRAVEQARRPQCRNLRSQPLAEQVFDLDVADYHVEGARILVENAEHFRDLRVAASLLFDILRKAEVQRRPGFWWKLVSFDWASMEEAKQLLFEAAPGLKFVPSPRTTAYEPKELFSDDNTVGCLDDVRGDPELPARVDAFVLTADQKLAAFLESKA